ncbi:hypothetical protein MMC10_009372 [Thelotrema lepadinum]|nr:hypothetical protein [Thelotrema lepadinum]
MSNGQTSAQDWEMRKETITSLYIGEDMSINDLVKCMDNRGFRANKGQFERKLRTWGISKNLPPKQWKAIAKKIKVRKAMSKASDVYLYGQRLCSPKIRKAIQRYDLPKLCPSPSPSLGDMQDIRISTPISSQYSKSYSPIRIGSRTQNESVGVDQRSAKPFHVIVTDQQPFLKLQDKLREFCEPLLQSTMQLSNTHWLRELMPNIAYQISPSLAKSCQELCVFGSGDTRELWGTLLKQLAHFRIPMRTPDTASAIDASIWVAEFIVIGSANGLLRPYEDESISWLIESEVEILDQFLRIVSDNDFYNILDRILDLRTSTTYLFSAQMLLSSVAIEDEHLLDMLLAKKVPLDGTRDYLDYDFSALHLAVHKHNEKFVRRLLNAGIDPDGYFEDGKSFPDSRPLCFLLSHSSRLDLPRISDTILKVVLESRRRVFQASDCIAYVEILILRAWEKAVAQCFPFLRGYYQILSEPPSSENLHAIAHQEEDDLLAATMLTSAIRRRTLTADSVFEKNLMQGVLQRRCDLLLTVFIQYWQWFDTQTKTYFVGLLDKDRTNYLLDFQIELPGSLYLFSRLAVELQDISLPQVLFGTKWLFAKDIVQKLDSGQTIDPRAIVSRATMRTAASPMPRDSYMMAAQLISAMDFYGVTHWRSTFPYVFEAATATADIEVCELIIYLWRLACPKVQLRGTFEQILRGLVRTRHSGGTALVCLVLEVFKQQNWYVNWSKMYKPGTHGGSFEGNLSMIEKLTGAGMPCSKTVLLACISGPYSKETLPYLLETNPNLIQELTLVDLSHCFNCRHWSVVSEINRADYIVSTNADEFGPVNDYTDKLKSIEVANILEILANYGLALETEWRDYLPSKSPGYLRMIGSGFPCPSCSSMRSCLRPLCAAISLVDTILVKEMINEGFNVGQSWSAPCCISQIKPLTLATDNGRSDLVDELLEAGAEVDAYGKLERRDFTTEIGTVLQIASSAGNYVIVHKLLQAGADINAPGGPGGLSALSAASSKGRLDVINLLIVNNPHRRKLKYECRRASKHAHFNQHNQIARMLENFVASLTAKLGRDEVDDGIDSLYECYVKFYSGWNRNLLCSRCWHLKSTEPKKWFASVIYFGNILLPWRGWFRLKRKLNGDETLEEIEGLLEYDQEEENLRSGNPWYSDSDEEEASQGDEDSNYEDQEDEQPES